jgi:hypothetical protein
LDQVRLGGNFNGGRQWLFRHRRRVIGVGEAV